MRTDYITPESAADQNPTEKNVERMQEKKQPPIQPNPGKNEGHNYGKGAPEENNENLDIDPSGKLNEQADTTANGGDKNPQPEPEKTNQEQYEEETGPATPPEKTRENPKA